MGLTAGERAGPASGQRHGERDEAVAALYAEHFGSLFGLALLLVDNAEEAQDVVQEAFVGLFERWGRLRDPDRALGYLRVSVVNAGRASWRRRLLARRPAAVRPAVVTDSAETALNRLAGDTLAAALRRLPRRERQAVVLRYYVDCSEAQTAATLGVSVGAVKGYTSRGLARLADLLGQARP